MSIIIKEQSLAYGIGWVWPTYIDKSGVTSSIKRAMSDACDQATRQLDQLDRTLQRSTRIVIDGPYNFLPNYQQVSTLIGADALIDEVSAASIIAKVARDEYMSDIAAIMFPDYGFDQHVGYGTPRHIAALHSFGVTVLHRASYKPIRLILESKLSA